MRVPLVEIGKQLMFPTFTQEAQLQIEYKPNFLASELEDSDASGKVYERYADWNVNMDGWWEPDVEGFKENMKEIGVNVSQVYFSGFNSQGDGACFECELDMKVFIPELINNSRIEALKSSYEECNSLLLPKELGLRLVYDKSLTNKLCEALSCSTHHNGHYYHSGCMDVSMGMDMSWFEEDDCTEGELWYWMDNFYEGLKNMFTEFLRGLADDLYKKLSDSDDYLRSQLAVFESLDCNEKYFFANGEEELEMLHDSVGNVFPNYSS